MPRRTRRCPPSLRNASRRPRASQRIDLLELLERRPAALGKRKISNATTMSRFRIQAGIYKLVDPYTDYTDKDRVAEREKDLQGFFTGIGVVIRRDLVKDALLVVSRSREAPPMPRASRPATTSSRFAGKSITPAKSSKSPRKRPPRA